MGKQQDSTRNLATSMAAGLDAAGLAAKVAEHNTAVAVWYGGVEAGHPDTYVWLPDREMGGGYYWGDPGSHHEAPDAAGVDEVIALVLATAKAELA